VYQVKDGSRTLQFNGSLLGKSSSWRRGSTRWIEFELYQTENGSYVLSRVGVSLIYHGAACSLVKRYGLVEASPDDLSKDAIPCEECGPILTDLPLVFHLGNCLSILIFVAPNSKHLKNIYSMNFQKEF
jgi:hypothetical protein